MNVLLVNSDKTTQQLLKKSLNTWGYDVTPVKNGQQALAHLADIEIDIIIADGLMPELNGFELCRKIRLMNFERYIYFILISANDRHQDHVQGLQCKVDDYVTQPLKLDEIKTRLEIGTRIITLERELNQKYQVIKRTYNQSVHLFAHLLESYNKTLGSHSRHVGQLSLKLAQKHPGILSENYPIVETAGLLHDIGLIGLPDTLVTKSVIEMTGDEKAAYMTHSERGEAILNQVDMLRPVARIVRWHHEQVNGRGFPDGLTEKQIPLTAAIVGAASIYDQLTDIQKVPFADIPAKLQPFRGYQLHPELVDILLDIHREKVEEEAKHTYRKVDVKALEAGMTLASDVQLRTGAFVMAADTPLDDQLIDKLKHYYELGNINRNIFIKK